jgi:alpha-1,2-mannosyltransferase
MGWERRGVAVAAATPVSVVGAHALGTLQAAWIGPSFSQSAAAFVLPLIAAGLAHWWKPSFAVAGSVGAMVGGGLAAAGMLPWGFLPLLLLVGVLLSTLASRIERALPQSVDGAWKRSRGKTIAWTVLALVMLLQVSRLSVFMANRDSTWGSTFPPVEFTVTHMCMASYVHAADLTRRNDPNLYDPEHYPNFGLTEAEDIETPVAGLQPYLADSFHYPPPFLLLPRTWLALSNDYLVMRSVWFAIQLLTFVAFAVLLARWVGGSAGAWALWMLPLVLTATPTMFNFQFGQIHVFTIWTAMGAMMAFEVKRPALGGLLLAGGIASKLFPGILVLYLLLQKRWRDLAWTGAFAAVVALLTVGVTGTVPFAQFFRYLLPRLVSGEAFSFATETLVITTNLSIPGTVWKLDLLGIEGGRSLLGPASTVYTVLILIATWFAARLDVDRIGRVQIWLALLILASLRSPLVPTYGVAPVLWLMTLQLDRVDTIKGLVWFGISWFFISSVPPAPNPVVTIALYGVAQVAMLYWVLKPYAGHRSVTPKPLARGD